MKMTRREPVLDLRVYTNEILEIRVPTPAEGQAAVKKKMKVERMTP